jgi:hypothetical protein
MEKSANFYIMLIKRTFGLINIIIQYIIRIQKYTLCLIFVLDKEYVLVL